MRFVWANRARGLKVKSHGAVDLLTGGVVARSETVCFTHSVALLQARGYKVPAAHELDPYLQSRP